MDLNYTTLLAVILVEWSRGRPRGWAVAHPEFWKICLLPIVFVNGLTIYTIYLAKKIRVATFWLQCAHPPIFFWVRHCLEACSFPLSSTHVHPLKKKPTYSDSPSANQIDRSISIGRVPLAAAADLGLWLPVCLGSRVVWRRQLILCRL